MTTRFIKAVTLLACAVFSTLALADAPARVGRIALTQGQVSISGDAGEQAAAALVNWPVTSQNVITTGAGARTEIRIGSSSVRLDGDSSLEVSELDDDSLRLRLDYGSVNVRIVSPEALAGFELVTANARVRLQEPGRLRVDAERVQGATAVNVFDGVALVEDRGTQLIVRAGRSAEVRDDDVRTGQAVRDGFDDWSAQRDQYDDRSTSARYVTSDMTGYEDLDQNGVWRDDPEYGPLWLPTTVAPGWAPYRDGSWTWIAPWGWTWVDNAPWGYAPFHYGRWVQVNRRWAWAPGRHAGRPVWSPALVGWVGGADWNLSFGGGRHRPAQGWYPLTPRDAYVPGYRLSQQHLLHLNRDVRPDRGDERRGRDEHRREGLTVVPQEQFGHRGTVAVRNAPRAVVPPLALQNAPAVAPSAPLGVPRVRDGRGDRFDRDGRADRFDRDFIERNRQHRPELIGVPAPRQQMPAAAAGQPPAPSPFTRRDGRPGFDDRGARQPPQVAVPAPTPPAAPVLAPAQPQPGRRDGRPDFGERRQHLQPMPAAIAPLVAPPAAPPAALAAPVPVPQAAAPEQRHGPRSEGEHRMRQPDAGLAPPPHQLAPPLMVMQPAAAPPAPAPAPVARPAPPPAPAPVPVARPAAVAAAAPTPVARPPAAAAQPAASEPAPRKYRGDSKRAEERER